MERKGWDGIGGKKYIVTLIEDGTFMEGPWTMDGREKGKARFETLSHPTAKPCWKHFFLFFIQFSWHLPSNESTQFHAFFLEKRSHICSANVLAFRRKTI